MYQNNEANIKFTRYFWFRSMSDNKSGNIYHNFTQDMYQKYLDSDLEENIPREEDPFWEPPEPVLIGTANAYLQVCCFIFTFCAQKTEVYTQLTPIMTF